VAPARRRSYGSFPTTADVGIRATGRTPGELFEALGLGLFALMTDLRTVRPLEERTVTASASDLDGLVVAYLSQLILLQQDDGFLAREIRAHPVGRPPTSVLAVVRGERFVPGRHPRRTEVKAITMHQLRVDLAQGRARVIVDI
jgi:SHS2 domain-containing protein